MLLTQNDAAGILACSTSCVVECCQHGCNPDQHGSHVIVVMVNEHAFIFLGRLDQATHEQSKA